MSENTKNLQKNDPIKKQANVTAADMGNELSPMSPPEAFTPPSDVKVEFENLHPFLQELTQEHIELKEEIGKFKKVLAEVGKNNLTKIEDIKGIVGFLDFFHETFVPHNKKEELNLFKILNERLIQIGEHSAGSDTFTGIRILEDEHITAITLGGGLVQLVRLLTNIKDEDSSLIIKNQFLGLSKELIDLLELHIFREDNIIFGQAQNLLTKEELDLIAKDFK